MYKLEIITEMGSYYEVPDLSDRKPDELIKYVANPATSIDDMFVAKSMAVQQISAAIDLKEIDEAQEYITANHMIMDAVNRRLNDVNLPKYLKSKRQER